MNTTTYKLVYKSLSDDSIQYVASGNAMSERQADRVLTGAMMRGCRDDWYPELVEASTCPDKGAAQGESA